jgi:hypothetical protein
MPKYIGPYKVTRSHPENLRYTLNLPQELKAQRIHSSFHVNLLRPFQKNDNLFFLKRQVHAEYDFSNAEDEEWLVDEIITHGWERNKVSSLVQWNLGDTTWERYMECQELSALD